MALELPYEATFNDIMSDINFLTIDNDLLNGAKKRKSRSPRKSLQNQGKENKTSDENVNKKVKKVSRKSTKEPLKVITSQVKSPLKRKSVGKSPMSDNKKNKKTQTVPKIIIYEDSKASEKKEKRCRQVSKSWEGRRTISGGQNNLKVATPLKSTRHSLSDLSNLDTSGKQKSEKTKRSFKLKPTDPEFLKMISKLEILFPGVDPEFLKTQFIKFKGSLAEIMEFLLLKENTNELPTRVDYMRRLETEELQNKFLESFSVESFLKAIPDPWEYFLKTHRRNCVKYSEHSFHYLKNKFKKHYIQAIQEALAKNDHSLYLAHKELNKKNKLLKMRMTNRSKYECDVGRPLTFNINFMQEVAFIENEAKIRAHIKKADAVKQKRIEKAQKEGIILECHCCTETNLLSEDAVRCPADHIFCKDCIVKYVEIEKNENHYQFKCLMKCKENFSLELLQTVLSPFVMAQIIKRNDVEAVKSDKMEDLVYCPFCYYVTVMPKDLIIVKCPNPICLRETCRNCKQLNHIPLTCQELKESDKIILPENETESPLCIRCNKEFVKKEDSSRMDCPCGGTMCSICRQPFPECPHFKEHQINTQTEPSRRHSLSSGVTEYTVEDTYEDPSEGEPEGDNHSPKGHFEFLLSRSETF